MKRLPCMKDENNNQYQLLILATNVAASVALILMVLKFIVWDSSGSVSLLASGVDSLMDALASLVSWWAVRVALRPPNEKHPFGHSKAEPLAGLAQAILIIFSAFFLCVHSIERWIDPQPIQHTDAAMWLMGVSIAMTLALLSLQFYVITKTQSLTIKADALHYLSDVLANIGVLIALFLTAQGIPQADGVIGVGIGIYILFSAIQLAKQSIDILMDKALEPESINQIRNIIFSHDEVINVHQLKTRDSGRRQFIQMHLLLDGQQSLSEANQICSSVQSELHKMFPNADIIIYKAPTDPENYTAVIS